MHRNQLLSLLENYALRFPEEIDTAKQVQLFVETNQNCFDRALSIGHITGSAWILSCDKSQVLLTHHKKLNIWVQLGGHADGDSDIARVAMKEAEEESGLQALSFVEAGIFDIDIHEIPARKNEAAHLHYDCRFLIQAQDSDYIVSDESHDLAWINLSEMSKVSSEDSILRMVQKTLSL